MNIRDLAVRLIPFGMIQMSLRMMNFLQRKVKIFFGNIYFLQSYFFLCGTVSVVMVFIFDTDQTQIYSAYTGMHLFPFAGK
jgi:hypothetical protein